MQDPRAPLDVFVGRKAELVRVAEVITLVDAGQPWLVAIEGEAGVGKAALARHCLAGAAEVKVLSARCDQAETDLDFGLVDQLLRAAGDGFFHDRIDGRGRVAYLVVRGGGTAAGSGGRAASRRRAGNRD